MSYSDSDMPDGMNMADGTPSGSRLMMLAALVVWALIVTAAALIAPPLMIVTLSALALVIIVAALIGRGWGATLVGLALVAVLVLGALYALRGILESYPCDASGTDPECRVSHAPAP